VRIPATVEAVTLVNGRRADAATRLNSGDEVTYSPYGRRLNSIVGLRFNALNSIDGKEAMHADRSGRPLAGLDMLFVKEFMGITTTERFKKKDVVFREGEQADYFYTLIEGGYGYSSASRPRKSTR